MKFVKLAFISIIVIFLVLTAISLMLPSHVRVSRAINISASVTSIHRYVSDLRQWQQWNVLLADSSISITAVGHSNINTNRFTIDVLVSKPDSVGTRWRQPNGKVFTGSFALIPAQNVTIVQWYFDFNLRWYPWEKFGSIIYDERMGPGMENSLTQLKTLVETSP
ncbi:MAG TPA: SRPBCC family protein [Chitinophagaceae bacterium]|nr:SRPBCC family protein [Chitinophagaceae bacterium]